MTSVSKIESRAKMLLEMKPSPVARLRLLRDVLLAPPYREDPQSVSNLVGQSKQVHYLTEDQRVDGGWGAFHSRSKSSSQKIASTEVAVERSISLGLGQDHPVLTRTKEYILSIMRGENRFPDYHEKNDRWETGMRLFLASTLSLIDPLNEELEIDRALWREIAMRTFRSGTYSEQDEIQAHLDLTGASVKNSYLKINNRYSLNILGSKEDLLPPEVEMAIVNWLWQYDEGIGYLEMPLSKEPTLTKPGPLDRWFTSLEMMSRLFCYSVQLMVRQIEWIWGHHDSIGLWDFGPRSTSSTFMPLADDWRSKEQRRIDWSTRVLILASSNLRA
jgi:hypothetical protein